MRFQSNFIFIATKIDKNELNRKNTVIFLHVAVVRFSLCFFASKRNVPIVVGRVLLGNEVKKRAEGNDCTGRMTSMQ